MSYSLLKVEDFPLTGFKEYRKAIPGLYHIAFVDNEYNLFLSIDDKKSIEASLSFYNLMKEKGIKTYPLYINNGYKNISIDKIEVVKEILGLPDLILDKLDFKKDIISQLNFKNKIFELKKYAYKNMYDKIKRKWYVDDFKCYLLINGIFFMQDETIPFIDKNDNSLPVLIDEKNASKLVKQLISDVNSTLLYLEYNDDIDIDINKMKEYDVFSFSNRVDYFINNLYDEKIANISSDNYFKEKYSKILRRYLASIINYLYDDYSKNVLFIDTSKKSIMTKNKVEKYYVVSSLNSEMYSLDDINYFYPLRNKDYLIKLYDEYKAFKDPLLIYKKLELPYVGYNDFKNALKSSKKNPFLTFEYLDIDVLSDYSSIKRSGLLYNLTLENDNHNKLFILREMKKQGIIYTGYDNKVLELEDKISIDFVDENIDDVLKPIFDQEAKLSDIPFTCYKSMVYQYIDSESLFASLNEIDRISENKAMHYFYHHLTYQSLKDNLESFCKFYNINLDIEANYSFFSFLISLPLYILEEKYKNIAFINQNYYLIDKMDEDNVVGETFEIGLPYKYVNYSRIAYTFRKTPTSFPYFCSCQKEAIFNLLNYFYSTKKVKTCGYYNANIEFIKEYKIPDVLIPYLNLDKPLFDQFKFKDNLCHLCNHKEPSYYEENIISGKYKTNTIFETYIHSIGCKNNIFSDTVIIQEEFNKKIDNSMDGKDNLPIVSYNIKPSNMPTLLRPYFNLSGLELATLLITTFSVNIGTPDFDYGVIEISKLSKKEVEERLFSSKYKNYKDDSIRNNVEIFPRLRFVYSIISLAYKFKLAENIIPFLDERVCLDIDYNPKLKHPYVYLGKNFNAYSDDDKGDNYYFCSCDKEAIFKTVETMSEMFIGFENDDKNLRTIALLAISGLPYLVIKKFINYQDYKDVLKDLVFEDKICRRCLNENHAAYLFPFLKALPYKDEMEADYAFIKNFLAKDGIYFADDYDLSKVKYEPTYFYNLRTNFDYLLPPMFVNKTSDDTPNSLYRFLSMNETNLQNYLFDFISKSEDDKTNLAVFNNLMIKNFKLDNNFIYKILSNAFLLQNSDFKNVIDKYMPSLKSKEDNITYPIYNDILGFFTYLLEIYFSNCALNEKRIGRR